MFFLTPQGSTDALLDRCRAYLLKDGQTAPLTQTDRLTITNMARQFSVLGQRILSFAVGAVCCCCCGLNVVAGSVVVVVVGL